MKMKKDTLLVILIILLIFTTACIRDDEEEDKFSSPSLSDNITWRSFGKFELKNEGSDKTARRIINDFGWHVYDRHNGGYGDTLQIASPNEAVIFVWAYNTFYGFVVTKGWTGITENGAYIGIDRITFHKLHPEFIVVSNELSQIADNNSDISVRAYFKEGFLEELYIGSFFRR